MYAVLKHIKDNFAAYTNPSFGAIKPALTRLEKEGCVRSRRAMSDGGKQSGYYSITTDGLEKLKNLILETLSENPLQFLSDCRIKISCASFLAQDERKQLFFHLKSRAQEHKFSAENILNDEYTTLSFYQRVTLDNAICEYTNLITFIEGLEKENGSNS